MEKKEAYAHEIKAFRDCFNQFRDRKIVLYGIGRYTATLLSALSGEFIFVGLLDRDSENVGKVINGVEIIDLAKAEQIADLIIINTQESYWNIIYQRIKGVSIPIYLKSGELAQEKNNCEDENNPYWDLDIDILFDEIMQYEVVSFDIFDTLISRKVFLPKDVFDILEKRAYKQGICVPIKDIRQSLNAVCIDKMYCFDDIYDELEKKLDISQKDILWLKNEEKRIEKEISYPRKTMIELFNRVCAERECYIISDMYHSDEFLLELLETAGILNVDKTRLLISCKIGKSKKTGELWDMYKKIIGKKRAIHIGDNYEADGKNPKKFGIDCCIIDSPIKLWEHSSIKELLPVITSKESLCAGLICSKLFCEPFSLGKNKGRVLLHDYDTVGYVLFGSLVYTFLSWINQHKNEGKGKLLFLARDGYWLNDNYSYLKKVMMENDNSTDGFFDADYLAISRRIVLVSGIDKQDGWENLLKFPFVGTFGYFCKIRLGLVLPSNHENKDIQITMPADYALVSNWLNPYKNDVVKKLKEERDSYIEYLKKTDITEEDYVVDLWFNGNNQYYLSKVLKKKLTGFYIVANMEDTNLCKINNTLIPCFQSSDDLLAERNPIYKMAAFVEAVFTAPYGMILSVDNNGQLLCGTNKGNQKNWKSREIIDRGVKEFIRDYVYLNGGELNADFVNSIWNEVNENHFSFLDNMKKEFYCDNALVKEQEYLVFE